MHNIMSKLEESILNRLNLIGYKDKGLLLQKPQFQIAVEGGLKNIEYTKLVNFLMNEIRTVVGIDKKVNAMSSHEDSVAFVLEITSLLKELNCPYTFLTHDGFVSDIEQLQDVCGRLLLLDYLTTVLLGTLILQEKRPGKKIDSRLIPGNAREEQILVAAYAYLDRADMVQKAINELFHLIRFKQCKSIGQAPNIVLEAMGRHLYERDIQICGSAALLFIVKVTGQKLHNDVKMKRKIITTLVNGMSVHKNNEAMMRNACLTLCEFEIPVDVVTEYPVDVIRTFNGRLCCLHKPFDYERLVNILLHSVDGMAQESFVQRISIYLLNSLSCQVDGHQKVKQGELGTIDKMIWLITDRLKRGLCDDVLEVAWTTMWNVTDGIPSNCRRFLENKGMEHFWSCLEKFPNKDELLRNMMGLLANVAEVKELRHNLVTPEFLSVFSRLLDSRSDGIEVSYNAASVISHIASDGPDVWTVAEPSRSYVLNELVLAIDRWDLNSQRKINYISFEPILYLVKVYHTPECQRWAVWVLANLTKVYPEKYCTLVKKEGGLRLLEDLILHPLPPLAVKTLAAIVIENCRKLPENGQDRAKLC